MRNNGITWNTEGNIELVTDMLPYLRAGYWTEEDWQSNTITAHWGVRVGMVFIGIVRVMFPEDLECA